MINLVIACWGGRRRLPDPFYDEHRGCFIRSQIKYLSEVKHNITQITFVDNLSSGFNTSDYKEALRDIPDMIGDTLVLFHQRPNSGFSYGAFNFAVNEYIDEFDYFIFLEDDQIIIEDNFDKFLVEEFNRHRLCSYLCALYKNKHAALSFGITSKKILKQVIRIQGGLPFFEYDISYSAADGSQVRFSQAFVFGYHRMYDFSGKYKMGYIYNAHQKAKVLWIGKGEKVFMLPQQLMRGNGTELRRIEDVRTQKWANT